MKVTIEKIEYDYVLTRKDRSSGKYIVRKVFSSFESVIEELMDLFGEYLEVHNPLEE